MVKPATSSATTQSSTPFMINANKPKVKHRNGKDARRIMGLRKIFKKPRTIATTMASVASSTLMPGTTCGRIKIVTTTATKRIIIALINIAPLELFRLLPAHIAATGLRLKDRQHLRVNQAVCRQNLAALQIDLPVIKVR